MIKISNEVKTALLVISGIIIFIFGFSYLKSNNILTKDRKFYGIYTNVEGLLIGTPVTINGFQIGSVEKIKLDPSSKLVVTFRIESDFSFSKNSIARIYESGLIGGKALAIVPSEVGDRAKNGDTLQTDIAPGLTQLVNDKLTPLQEKIEDMVVHADSVLISFNNVMNLQVQEDLRNSVNDFSSTISSLQVVIKSLEGSISAENGDLNKSFKNLASLTYKLNVISDTIHQADIGKTLLDLQQTVASINSVMHGVKSGQGSMGKLFATDSLHQSLNETNSQIQLLLEDMRFNPKRYVHFSLFGKKETPYKEQSIEE